MTYMLFAAARLESLFPLASGPVPTDVEPGEGSLGLLIVYAVVAIGFSFFCSVAEAVLLSITPSYIATLKTKGKGVSVLLSQLKENIDRPLAAILSLNTIAHTVGATGVGAEAAGIWGSSVVGLVSAIMTLAILVLSEIIPKTIGAVYWRPLAPWVARAVQILILVLYPLVWLSDQLTKLISGGADKHVITREEVAAMAKLSAAGGELDTNETRILQNLFLLDRLTAQDIMTPRTVMIAFPEGMTVGEVVEKHPDLPVSRVPLYKTSIDQITGLILKTDILLAQAKNNPDTKLSELRREVRTIRDDASLKRLLGVLLNNREHLAIVVDQYGGTDGLVTLEDLIETLLGVEIVDESDASTDMQKVARRRWEKRAASLGLNVHGVDESQDGMQPLKAPLTPPSLEASGPANSASDSHANAPNATTADASEAEPKPTDAKPAEDTSTDESNPSDRPAN